MKKHLYIFGLTFSLLVLGSCDNEPEEAEKPSADQSEMLENYADNFIVPAFKKSLESNSQLLSQLKDESVTLIDLQNSFKSAYMDWQKCSFYNFGPATSYALLSQINIYPTDESAVIDNVSNPGRDIRNAPGDEKGYPTLDFLLFSKASLEQEEKELAIEILSDIIERETKTISEWESFYRDVFVSNGGYNSGSATSFLLNSFIQFYEKYMRDGKLGIPLGKRNFGTLQPQTSEALYSNISHELMQANISAMKDFFYGGNGYGLDNLLKSTDSSLEEEKINEIKEHWTQIETDAKEINTHLNEYISTNENEASDLYALIQKQLVLLKIDVTGSLGVKITFVDTDGD